MCFANMGLPDRARLPPRSDVKSMGLYISSSVAAAKTRKFYTKNSIITSWYIGKKVRVYCGNRFITLEISRGMVGYKFGQFIMTKRMGSFIHKKKKKKKGKKK
jgi:ribosomal protein S19